MLENIKKISELRHTWIWAIIDAAIAHMTTRLNHPRKRLFKDSYPRISLVILEQDIILRLMFLNKVVFKQQGILLIIYDYMMNVTNLADKDSRLTRLLFIKEIGRYAPFEVLSLANVNYLSCLVEILIDSWLIWQDTHERLEVFKPLGI